MSKSIHKPREQQFSLPYSSEGDGTLNSKIVLRKSYTGKALKNESSWNICDTCFYFIIMADSERIMFQLFCASEKQNLPSRVQMMLTVGLFVFWHQK